MMNLLGFYVKIFYEMAVNSQTVNKMKKKRKSGLRKTTK